MFSVTHRDWLTRDDPDVAPAVVTVAGGFATSALGISTVRQVAKLDEDAPLSAGFLASATLVTAAVTAVGGALQTDAIAVPAALAILLVLAVLELTPARKSLLLRQTPRTLPWVFGSTWGGLAWGLDTGAMVTTLRTSLGSHATLGLCLLGFGSAWSGVAYAVGFCVR